MLRAAPEKVYRAFLDADAKAKWLPPNGFTCRVHHMDAKVGGTYKMSFTNFTTGRSHSFGGEYLELVPHERIRYTDQFEDPNLPGTIQVVPSKTEAVATGLAKLVERYEASIEFEARVWDIARFERKRLAGELVKDRDSAARRAQRIFDTSLDLILVTDGYGKFLEVSGASQPILTPVQPFSLCEAVTIATDGASSANCAK